MITALFHDSDTARVRGLWQWDYGQVLRIQGLQLPTAVEIQFSLDETGGESKTRVGVTKDGVTDVVIPDFALENEGATSDYNIYAFIYLTDETSGKTVKKIVMYVWARSKPEAFDTPGDTELFREAIAEVNKSSAIAQTAEKSAKAWAHGDHENYPERDEDNAKYYAEQARKDATQTQNERNVVSELSEHVNTVAMQVDTDKTEASQYKEQAAASSANALQSEQAAKTSESAAQKAMSGAEAAEGQAELFANQAAEDKSTVEAAKTLIMQMGQEVSGNKASVERTVKEFEAKRQQAIEDINDAEQNALDNIGNGVDSSLTIYGKAADAGVTGAAIDELKGDIGYLQAGGIAPFMTDFFDLDYGVNRFNGSVTTGILKSDGTINPNNTNYCTTDYIYCSDMVGKYPIFSIYRTNLDIFFTYSYQVICFYDVKHKLLSKNGFYGGANVKPDSTVVPVGAVYLRFSTFALGTYPTDVFQLTFEETKTGPTVYTDYSEPKEIIKQKHIIDTNTDAFRDIAESYSVSTSKFLQSCAKTPMITWVDDDCNYNSIAEVKSLCDELEIKCTFGCITRDLSTAKILERLKEYQSNGFHIASHTHTHDRWYKDTTNGTMFTIDECEADLITSLCTLRENGFLDGDMMIFSGGSAQRDGVEEIVSKWCRCAVKTNGIVNHLYGDGRYFIRRVFINKSKGYDYYKGLIDEAISNGDWLVFGSHSYDTSETGFDFDLMRNILQYAKSQSVSIKTLNQAYKIRKSVYDFYELFN